MGDKPSQKRQRSYMENNKFSEIMVVTEKR
jgi:hypothetical protein